MHLPVLFMWLLLKGQPQSSPQSSVDISSNQQLQEQPIVSTTQRLRHQSADFYQLRGGLLDDMAVSEHAELSVAELLALMNFEIV